MDRNEIGFSTPTDGAIDHVPPAAKLAAISLCACGGRFGAGGAQIYPWVEHTPSPLELQFHTPEDSLWFQIEEDCGATRPPEGTCGLSSHVAGSLTLEVSRAGTEDEVLAGNEGEEGEGSDAEAEEGDGEDQEDRLDYESSLEAGGGEVEAHRGSRIRSEVHIVQHDDSESD